MTVDDVYLVGDTLTLATAEEITEAERALGTRFPPGYRAYVTTLGAGTLNGQVRVLVPTEIIERTAEYRATEAELAATLGADGIDPWDIIEVGRDILPPERWLSAVLVIDPGDGHRIVVHPDAPDDLIFIEDQNMEVYRVGRTVDEALRWFLETGPWADGRQTRVLQPDGQLVARPVRYFDPDGEREQLEFNLQRTGLFPEIRAQLLDLAQKDPQGTLFISTTETDEDGTQTDEDGTQTDEDGTQTEVLHLFVREEGAAVWCSDAPIVQITFERERPTPQLDGLLAYCRTHSRPF